MIKARLRQLALAPLRLALYAAGRAYVPGYELTDALKIADAIAPDHIAVTLGYFHSANDTPQRIAGISHQIISAVADLPTKGYLSIKAPALGYDPDLLNGLVRASTERGLIAHFDSHELHTAEQTMACVRAAAALGQQIGLTIPGRWQRSLDDADEASRLGVRVRVVKGEWADPALAHCDLRQAYLDVIDRLAGKAGQVAVATHDPWLACEAIRRLQAAGTACELELLNGLPRRKMLAIGRQYGVPVRLYIPFGVAWRPYALSKAAENPRILWWIVKDATTGLLSTLSKHRRK